MQTKDGKALDWTPPHKTALNECLQDKEVQRKLKEGETFVYKHPTENVMVALIYNDLPTAFAADYNGRVMEATAISESKALANESVFTHVGNNHPGGNGRRANDLGRNGGWAAALVGDMEDKGTGRYGNGSSKWAGGSSAAQLSQFQKAARSASGGVLFGHDHVGDSASKRQKRL